MCRYFSTLILVAAFWGPPAIMIIKNQMAPGIGTGLGVPYGIVFGLITGISLSLLFYAASRRWHCLRPYYKIILLAALINIIAFPMANQGAFSLVN